MCGFLFFGFLPQRGNLFIVKYVSAFIATPERVEHLSLLSFHLSSFGLNQKNQKFKGFLLVPFFEKRNQKTFQKYAPHFWIAGLNTVFGLDAMF